MTQCEMCVEMGCSDNCANCSLGNPCLGCEHDGKDCEGQCYEPIPPVGYTDCFTPEKDNPYPLCVGGKIECGDCCLYTDYEKKHDPHEEVDK